MRLVRKYKKELLFILQLLTIGFVALTIAYLKSK